MGDKMMITIILLGKSSCGSGHNLTFFEKYLPLFLIENGSHALSLKPSLTDKSCDFQSIFPCFAKDFQN